MNLKIIAIVIITGIVGYLFLNLTGILTVDAEKRIDDKIAKYQLEIDELQAKIDKLELEKEEIRNKRTQIQ